MVEGDSGWLEILFEQLIMAKFYLMDLPQINPASFKISFSSFLIRLSCPFLLQLLVKNCRQFPKCTLLLRTILKFRTIQDFRKLYNSETLFGAKLLGRLLFSAVSQVEHFNIRIVVIPVTSASLVVKLIIISLG